MVTGGLRSLLADRCDWLRVRNLERSAGRISPLAWNSTVAWRDANGFGLEATSQYLGPSVAFNIPNGPSLSFGANVGLNGNSLPQIWRFNVSYEFQQVFRQLHRDRSDGQ